MDTHMFTTYTAMDIAMESVPLLIQGQRNPVIPKVAGIYVLLQETTIAYVGKTGGSLYQRLHAYTHEPTFTHVWWHVVEPWQAGIYELLYIHTLHPSLNGHYHHYAPSRRQLTLAQQQLYDAESERLMSEVVMKL